MSDPISRLEVCRSEIDRLFGSGYAARHPELVVAMMASAASDWAAMRLSTAIECVAAALLEEEAVQNGPGIVRPHELMRP
jgi:hypothetical protein